MSAPASARQTEARVPPRTVYIVGGAAEDAESYGNGRPGVWMLVIVWELAFTGLCVWVGTL